MSLNPDSASEPALLEALDERAGPARRLSVEESEAAVQAAVERALPARRAWRERRRLSALLIAAALGVTGIAAAFVVTQRGWSISSPTNAVPSSARAAPLASLREQRGAEREALPNSPALPSATAVPAEPSPADSSSSNGPERVANARVSALDLLKAANQLRRQARWVEAERAYAQIASNYGNTAQGPVAALAAASLRLEHLRDARGALRLYQAALRASSLSAEAELGIADCYRALGERQAEIAALRRLTSAHPEALFRERAERRLRALEAGKP